MSADRFDDLAKALATGTSRRRVLKAMAASVAGGALVTFLGTRQTAEARTCAGLNESCNNKPCCGNLTCRGPSGSRTCTPAQPQCKPSGATCSSKLECCSAVCANGHCK